MSYESFYGGRQGASFVIVERFEGINIPNPEFKEAYYAVNEDNIRFYPFILKKEDNYYSYKWIETTLDGSTVNVIYTETGQPGQEDLPIEYQKGMVQCFKQGGDTTDIVNYGEYVIIDTVSKDNPDNGKVFRRGMDFNNDLGGAEYIGQIVGPSGDSADLDLTYYDAIQDPQRGTGSYTADEENPGLVPGANDAEDSFNDAIEYAWATLKDKYNNIVCYQVGFKFPYLVQHFIARVRSAYKTNDQGEKVPVDDTVELIERIDDKEHPFFSKWKINVPKGIKGESVTNIETLPTKVRSGSTIYSKVDAMGHLSGARIVITSTPVVDLQTITKTKDKEYAELKHNNETWYAKLDDCYDLYFVRENINYDEHEEGDIEYNSINSYRVLKNVSINTGEVGVEGNQKVHVVYEGANENQEIEEDIGKPLNSIFETAIVVKSDYPPSQREAETDPNGVAWGSFLVYYTDPATRALYTTYTHYSAKQGKDVDGWVMLGNVFKPGSIQSLCNFNSASELDNSKPPEVIASNDPDNPNYAYKGWVVTVGSFGGDKEYYAYDYTTDDQGQPKGWYYVGEISVNTDPKTIVDIDVVPNNNLQINGIRFNSKVRKSIY